MSRKVPDSTPWSKIKDKKAKKHEKKSLVASKKSGGKTLSENELALLEKAFSKGS